MTNNLKETIHGKSDIQIGKNGITPAAINQISHRLKNNVYLKVRFLELADFEDVEEATSYLLTKIQARLVDQRGNTIVIQKK